MDRDGKVENVTSRVQVAQASNGVVTYLVSEAPETLPPVSARELERAWHLAREAAIAEQDGPTRLFRFHRTPDDVTDLALTDADARCWAAAVDAARGLDNLPGLSVCLRLLALVDLMARARWASKRMVLHPDGAEIDVALLRAAGTAPLTREARFDESLLHAQFNEDTIGLLAHTGPDVLHGAQDPDNLPTGASA